MAESMDFGMQLFRVFGGLLLVLGILACAAFAVKRFGHFTSRSGGSQALEVISRHHLDARNALMIVRVYEERFLVSVSPQGLQLLASLKPPSHGPFSADEAHSRKGAQEGCGDDE